MAQDKRLKLKQKANFDNSHWSKYGSFEFGNFLAKCQGIQEEFLGASSATIGSNKSVVTSLKLGSMIAKYIANDAAAKPTFDGDGLHITSAAANNDGVLFYSSQDFALPRASSHDKLIFECLMSLATVANCDEAGFIISNESTSNLDADTTFLASDTFIGININNGVVYIASQADAGGVTQTSTGLSLADAEEVHIKVELSSEMKASIYVNGSKFKSIDLVQFDAGDALRIVCGGLVDASAALATINIKQLCAYKLMA
jgi:hypothetical protein